MARIKKTRNLTTIDKISNKPKQKIDEVQQEKKNMLIKQFIQNTTISSRQKENKIKEITVQEKDNSEYKNKIKTLMEQVVSEKKKKADQIDKYKKLDKKYQNSRAEIDVLKSKIEELNVLNDKVNKLNQTYIKEIDSLKQQINDFKRIDERHQETCNLLKYKIKERSNKISEMNIVNTKLEGKYIVKTREYNELLAEFEREKEAYEILRQDYLKLDKKLNTLYADSIRYKEIIISNFSKRGITDLSKVEFPLKYRKKSLYTRIVNLIDFIKKPSYEYQYITFGNIIVKNKFSYYFKPYDEDNIIKIDISSLINKKSHIEDGIVVKAKVTNHGASIIRIYKDKSEFIAEKEKQIRRDRNINKGEKVKDLGINVLVITSFRGNYVRESLNSFGIKADIFDSYEKNPKRLKTMLSKYDMVFYVTKYSRHYCGDFIRVQPDRYMKNKYYTLDGNNIQKIVSEVKQKINEDENLNKYKN